MAAGGNLRAAPEGTTVPITGPEVRETDGTLYDREDPARRQRGYERTSRPKQKWTEFESTKPEEKGKSFRQIISFVMVGVTT